MPVDEFVDIGVLFGVFLSLIMIVAQLLLVKKDQKNYLFITAIACLGIYQLSLCFGMFGQIEHWQEIFRPLYILGMAALFSSIPAIFFFFRSLPDAEYALNKYALPHLLIPIFAAVSLLLFGRFPVNPSVAPPNYYDFIYKNSLAVRVIDMLSIICALLYFSFLFVFYYLRAKKAESHSKRNIIFVLYFLFLSLFFLLIYFQSIKDSEYLYYVFRLRFTIMLSGVFVFGYRFPYIANIVKLEAYREYYYKSQLANVNVELILKSLEQMMEKEHAYRENGLTMNMVAKSLDISSHQLSEIFNTRLETTFSAYINEKRIGFAEELLLKEPYKSVMMVAMECGFNTISTFNKAFKKKTGLSPSEYRKTKKSGKTINAD